MVQLADFKPRHCRDCKSIISISHSRSVFLRSITLFFQLVLDNSLCLQVFSHQKFVFSSYLSHLNYVSTHSNDIDFISYLDIFCINYPKQNYEFIFRTNYWKPGVKAAHVLPEFGAYVVIYVVNCVNLLTYSDGSEMSVCWESSISVGLNLFGTTSPST